MTPTDVSLTAVNQVLAYLSTCRPTSAKNTGSELRVERIGARAASIGWTLIFVTFGMAFYLSRQGPLSPDAKQTIAGVLLGGYAFFGIRIVTLVWLLWRGRNNWRQSVIDQVIERDEGHATHLLSCSNTLLNYARDWVKRQSDRRERVSNTLMKDLGVIPAIALLYAAYNAWQSFHVPLEGWHLDGALLSIFSQMINTFFWAGLLTMLAGLLASRVTVLRYAYRIELIDIALRMKELGAEAAAASKTVPDDNAGF
jgi:hypothetical protein